jgi:hypothetical protein
MEPLGFRILSAFQGVGGERTHNLSVVMAGLVPATHVLRPNQASKA